MGINHIRLSQIAGIISFLITGGINSLCKKCGKIPIASVTCFFALKSVCFLIYIKYSSLPWKGSSAFNTICGKFHHRKQTSAISSNLPCSQWVRDVILGALNQFCSQTTQNNASISFLRRNWHIKGPWLLEALLDSKMELITPLKCLFSIQKNILGPPETYLHWLSPQHVCNTLCSASGSHLHSRHSQPASWAQLPEVRSWRGKKAKREREGEQDQEQNKEEHWVEK